MAGKLHSHKVSINDRKRMNKRTSDMRKNGSAKGDIQQIFSKYYKDQVRALYRAVSEDK